MGNFWTTSEGEDLSKTPQPTSFDSANNFENIPDGTVLPAAPIEAANAEYEGDEYINIKWQSVDGDFKGRTVYMKLRVYDSNPKKRDRALRLLSAIDKNAGNPLAGVTGKPTDQDLSKLCGKPMDIRTRIWNIDGKTGNWVEAIGKLGELSGKAPAPAKKAGAAKPSSVATAATETFDDDIPF